MCVVGFADPSWSSVGPVVVVVVVYVDRSWGQVTGGLGDIFGALAQLCGPIFGLCYPRLMRSWGYVGPAGGYVGAIEVRTPTALAIWGMTV